MKLNNIIFVGLDTDEFGTPNPFCSYFCVSGTDSQWNTASAIAVPISTDAEPMNPATVCLAGKSEDDAMNELLRRLRELPRHEGLREILK